MGASTERRPLRALAALLAAAAVALAAAEGGAAQEGTLDEPAGPGGAEDAGPAGPARDPTLSVPSLQSLVTDDAPLRVRVRVRNQGREDLGDLRLLMTVHGRLTSRFALQQSLDEDPVTAVVHAVTRTLATVPANGARTVAVRQSLDELGLGSANTSAAVHPVRIALQSDGELVDEVVTAAVVAGRDAPRPLRVGVLLPLTGPPAELPGGRLDASAAHALVGSDRAVPSMLAALDRFPDTPVTLASDGLALTTLQRMQHGVNAVTDDGAVQHRSAQGPAATAASRVLDRIREITGQPGVTQIPLPYGRADLVALVRHGAAEEAARHVGDQTNDIERLTGQRPRERVLWPAAGINRATLDQLGGVAGLLVVSGDMVRTESGSLTPPPLRQLQAGAAGTLPALVPDPWIQRALASDDTEGGALLAARILAEVASVHLEQPGMGGRGLLIAPPPDTPVHGDTVGPLLSSLRAASFARLTGLDGLRETDTSAEAAEAVLDYPPSARAAELPAAYIDSLVQARAHVGSLASLMVEDQTYVGRLDRRLLQSASTAYRERRGDGRALIRDVRMALGDIEQAVSVPDAPPVTLAAEEGTLPVRLSSTADIPLRVRVTLRTAAYEIAGGPTREIRLPANQDRLLSFDVRALAPGGTSPVQVIVADPDGINRLATGTVVVRSTAVSVTGVIVTATAALFLLVALWRQLLRRRQRRRPGDVADQPRHEPTGAGR